MAAEMKILKIFLPVPVLLVISVISTCFADTNYPKELESGLIAETVSDFTKFGDKIGRESMYAAACVYRKRFREGQSFPWGCVALKRADLDDFVKREKKKYREISKEIMRKVFLENGPDTTDGATHYENIERFGLPKGWEKMKKIKKIGSHTFFAEK